MTEIEAEKLLHAGYYKPDADDWYDMIVGSFVAACLYGAGGVLFLMKWHVPKTLRAVYIVFILSAIVYRYWRDGEIKVVRTGLNKSENLNLLRSVFNHLDWPTYETSNQILVGDDVYKLKFIRARVVFTDDFIGYNFQYSSNVKSGRPAFFFGIRTYFERQFARKLMTFLEMNNVKQ